MQTFDPQELKKLRLPSPSSHKGQNGKLMVIGGSNLFHAASLWALKVASRIVDMVFYSSVPVNNEIVQKQKEEFRDGIIVPRDQIENYILEADAILIGPGMLRSERVIPSSEFQISSLKDINKLEDEGLQSYYLTKYLLEKYPQKRWVIDAGAVQMMEPEWLVPLKGNVIITPHPKEFERIKTRIKNLPAGRQGQELRIKFENEELEKQVALFAKEYQCTVLLKGKKDIVCSPEQCVEISGGNAGMTKGGTGDVLAGLVASLACKNDLFLAAAGGSYINKKAGEALFKKVGYYFNASDLADEIPRVLKTILVDNG